MTFIGNPTTKYSQNISTDKRDTTTTLSLMLRPGLKPVLMWLSTEPEALSGCGGTVIFIQDYNFMAASIREEPTEDTPTVPKCIPIMWQRRMVETVRIEYRYDANCD